MTQSERRVDLPPMPLPPELPADETVPGAHLIKLDPNAAPLGLSLYPASPANGEYREPMGEARKHGVDKRNAQRLERAQESSQQNIESIVHRALAQHGPYEICEECSSRDRVLVQLAAQVGHEHQGIGVSASLRSTQPDEEIS